MAADVTFIPAESLPESAARMFALTGHRDLGTRGPKRALKSLATALGLKVDVAATNAIVGEQVASVLGSTWRSGREFTDTNQVTLDGMNALLRAATSRLNDLSLRSDVDVSDAALVLRAFPTFAPAKNKQEAADRIAALTGSPRDVLGPGAKEHRVLFDDLARHVDRDLIERSTSKQAIAEALCVHFGVPWVDTGGSTGQTVTLEGLNLVLVGAERYFGVASTGWASAQDEARAALRVLRDGLADHWDGRETVTQMRRDQSRSWSQMEWPGFHYEDEARALLNAAFPSPPVGGPRRQYGKTIFDYASAQRVWDTKAHTVLARTIPPGSRVKGGAGSILNDAGATDECLAEQGLGFLILDGVAIYDGTLAFDAWHRAYTREGKTGAAYRSNSGSNRRRKAAFTPVSVRAFWIPDLTALQAGITGGWMRTGLEGARQPRGRSETSGKPRKRKYTLVADKAGAWELGRLDWPRNDVPFVPTGGPAPAPDDSLF